MEELKEYLEKVRNLNYLITMLHWERDTIAPKESIDYLVGVQTSLSMQVFDLTTDERLLSNEIYRLYDYKEGYKNWTEFINENIGESGFQKIIPSILFNWDDKNFEVNFKLQLKNLSNFSSSVMYRTSLQTRDCYDELPLIIKHLPKDCQLWIVLDGGYLHESAVNIAYNRCKRRIQNIREKILDDRNVKFVIAVTSYPDRAYDYGEDVPRPLVGLFTLQV